MTDQQQPPNSIYRILIVEDEPELRQLYTELLKDEGYTIEEAVNGEDGFNLIKKGGYNLVLLDIMLPKMDGLTILRKLEENPPEKPNGAIVILSNLGQDSIIAEGVALGARGYMIKSDYTPGQILDEVHNYLTTNQ